MKLIFAVLDVSLTMGLTRCYKTEGFLHLYSLEMVRQHHRPSAPSVCLSSVTFVCPTQAIEIFGSISTLFGTLALAICDLSIKISRRSSQGNDSVGGLN